MLDTHVWLHGSDRRGGMASAHVPSLVFNIEIYAAIQLILLEDSNII